MHHHSLYKSLQLLFEKRLGWELYRPVGTEWFEEGYWKNAEVYNNHPDTVAQFLQIRNTVPTKMGPRNVVKEDKDTHYVINDFFMDQKAITLDQFKEMDIDIVIASYFGNIAPYKDLIQKYKPNAKLVMQMGNEWPVPWDIVENLMASTGKVNTPPNKNVIYYHQEFDLDTYKYEPPEEIQKKKHVRNFVHCMMEHEMHRQDWEDFQAIEKLLPRTKFESYGISCRDGIVQKQEDIAKMMRESFFGVHLKSKGDGYGHVIHSWAAMGRPLIFRKSQYKGKLAEPLLEHRVTGLDLDEMSYKDIANYIKSMSPGEHRQMCEAMYKKFTDNVNFDKEADSIKSFMENLI